MSDVGNVRTNDETQAQNPYPAGFGLLNRDEWRCDGCGGIFGRAWTGEEAEAEAALVYRPEEITPEERVEVCDECLAEMRAAMPDMDARYREQGL